ncbi:MAG: hypothetical protein LBT51_00185 [Fusobacteriaceae bacterium]|jgi:H+/gluconate symporter-like permease|nr:hypothetical protein [Fusobacteriaceae bacterium]
MNLVVLSGIGLLIALIVLSVLSFKRVTPVISGPLAAITLCIFSKIPIYDSVTKAYVPGIAAFFTSYFLIFLLSGIMGKIYEKTAAAKSIGETLALFFGPKKAMLAVVLSTAVLIYGGITSFVVIFAIFPIALVLFEKADTPVRLIPGIATLGLWSFAMTGPASTQIQNIMPMQYLGTGSLAGLIPGGIGAFLMFALGTSYMMWEEKRAKARGEHFIFPSHVSKIEDSAPRPKFVIALIPIIFVIIAFNVFKMNIVYALLITDILSVILFWKYFADGNPILAINEGAMGSIPVIINTAAIVGFGAISKLSPFYTWAIDTILSTKMNPYVLAFVSTNAFAGLMGSSSGSLGLTFGALGDTFLQYGQAGYNLGYIHRMAAVGAAGLDTLPYCGAIISVLNVCGVSHKDGYFPIFINCTLIPILVGTLVMLPICFFLG